MHPSKAIMYHLIRNLSAQLLCLTVQPLRPQLMPVQVLDNHIPSYPGSPHHLECTKEQHSQGQKSKNEGFYSSSPSISMNNSSEFPSLRAFFNFP